MSNPIDQPTALEWLWRGLSLLAIPALAWVIKLSSDLARAEYQRQDHERRISQLENDNRENMKVFTEIKGLIIELRTQNATMAEDIKELKVKLGSP
jgi:uncharacterized protein YigA (DUF484 family)